RFTLGFGLRQFYPARMGDHLRQEVLIAVAAEDQLRLAAGANLKTPRDGAGGPLRLPVADRQCVEGGARLDGVLSRPALLAANHEVERDARLDAPIQAGEPGD